MTPADYAEIAQAANTALAQHSTFVQAVTEIRRAVTHAGRYADPQVFVLLGESRSGKTRVLETVHSQFPRVVLKEGTIVPVVRIRLPKGVTTKGVFSLILHEMGDQFSDRGTETERLLRINGFVERLQVKVIIIDEFQHLIRFSKRSEFDTADALKVLADLASVNLVLAGLPYGRRVIDVNPQLAGRARHPITMKRFDWNRPNDRGEFIAIVSAFAGIMSPLQFPDFDNDEWGFRWYCATGGLIGYVARLFKEVLDNAEVDAATRITLEALDRAQQSIFSTDEYKGARPFDPKFLNLPLEEAICLARSIGRECDPFEANTRTSAN